MKNVYLRPFTGYDGQFVARWIFDDEYERYFRHTSMVPTLEECSNYPNWSQNIIMMVNNENNETIGMASAYHVNYRNRVAKAGLLIDKAYQRQLYGHNAQKSWLDFLFRRMGFRKIIVENVDEWLTSAYLDAGFTTVGRLKANSLINNEWKDEILLECFAEDFKAEYK